MIMSMVNMPDEKRSVLFVVIELDNFERMKKGDPITLESYFMGGGLPAPKYPLNFSLLIAYEEDQDTLYALAKAAGSSSQGMKALFEYLERGRVFVEGKDGVEHFRKA